MPYALGMNRNLIEQLHHSPFKYVVALAGGGTQAAASLLGVPGASRTILEVLVPYHEHALTGFLGRPPENFCSPEITRELARRSYERATVLAPRQAVLGIGCTASLATDRPKRGDHRFHVAIYRREVATTYSLVLDKGSRSREEEENVLDVVLLNGLARAAGIATTLPLPLLGGEALETRLTCHEGNLSRFLRGELDRVLLDPDGQCHAEAPAPAVLLPGSFNPLHEGHTRLANVARAMVDGTAAFELCTVNVDKPALIPEDVVWRLQQFSWQAQVWLTRAPRFIEKAERFPGSAFVVGMDTAIRIIDARYYEGSIEQRNQALERIGSLGCRFLVAGRVNDRGSFTTLQDLLIPESFQGLFVSIDPARFRMDVSSTALRS